MLLHFVKKKRLFTTAVVFFFSFFLEEIDLPRICLDMKSADFVVGKFLDTTNAARLSILMFSWQPLLSPLIFQFINSARLRSKLNDKKYSHTHTLLRNYCSLITKEESNHTVENRCAPLQLVVVVAQFVGFG